MNERIRVYEWDKDRTKKLLYEEAIFLRWAQEGDAQELCVVAVFRLPDGGVDTRPARWIQFLDLPTPEPQAKPLSEGDLAHMEALRVRAETAEARLAWVGKHLMDLSTSPDNETFYLTFAFYDKSNETVQGKSFVDVLHQAMKKTGGAT